MQSFWRDFAGFSPWSVRFRRAKVKTGPGDRLILSPSRSQAFPASSYPPVRVLVAGCRPPLQQPDEAPMTPRTLTPQPLSEPVTTLPDEPPAIFARPLAYGYMRVPADVPDLKVRGMEQAVIQFARNQGLYFVTFFFEFDSGSREGFNELVTELVRADARHVVVPSLRHLARNALLQDVMRERLALDAGAEVHAMCHRTGD